MLAVIRRRCGVRKIFDISGQGFAVSIEGFDIGLGNQRILRAICLTNSSLYSNFSSCEAENPYAGSFAKPRSAFSQQSVWFADRSEKPAFCDISSSSSDSVPRRATELFVHKSRFDPTDRKINRGEAHGIKPLPF